MNSYRSFAFAVLALLAAPLVSAPASAAPIAAPAIGASVASDAVVQKAFFFGHRRSYDRRTYYRRPLRNQYYGYRTRPNYYYSGAGNAYRYTNRRVYRGYNSYRSRPYYGGRRSNLRRSYGRPSQRGSSYRRPAFNSQ